MHKEKVKRKNAGIAVRTLNGASLSNKTRYKVQQIAHLLGSTVDTVRRQADEAGIKIERQQSGPKTRFFSVENLFELANYRHLEREKARSLLKRKTLVVTIWAPKGGVGKTTIAASLACLFNLFGAKTLVVDLDFQSNLTLNFGYDSELSADEARAAGKDPERVVDLHFGNLMPGWPGGRSKLADVVKMPYGPFGPHLIPSDLTLDRLDTMLTFEALESRDADTKILELIEEGVSGKNPDFDLKPYDIILFDAAPAKNRMTRGALLASDFVVSPVSMEKFSTKSLSYLSTVLNELATGRHKRAPELAIVGNFFDSHRLRVIAQLLSITQKYQKAWLEQTIKRSEEFPKALTGDDTMPLVLSRCTSEPARELQAVALALLERMGVLDTATVEGLQDRVAKSATPRKRAS